MNQIVKAAIDTVGTQQLLAKACGVSQALVYFWLYNKRRVAPQHVIALSRATNGTFSPHQIRPDLPELFPQP